MPALKTHTRFFLRGSALVGGLLVLWWFALLNPLLYVLRQSANLCGSLFFGRAVRFITEASSVWTIEVPIDAVIPAGPEHPTPVPVHSIDFDLARPDAGAFTFGLPVYWAIVLAAGEVRRALRPLLLGTLAMWLAEVAMLLLYAELYVHRTAAAWTPSSAPVAAWLYRFGDYMMVSLIPYLIPFAVALWLHGGLRRQILLLGGTLAPAATAPATKAPARPPGQRKRTANRR